MNDYNPSIGGYFFPSGHGFGIGWTKNTGPSFGDLYSRVEGTVSSGWVRNEMINNIDFHAFFNDLTADYNDLSFKLTMEFGYGDF